MSVLKFLVYLHLLYLLLKYISFQFQTLELLHDLLFELVAFSELLGEGLLVVSDTRFELLSGDVYILDLDVEILTCGE